MTNTTTETTNMVKTSQKKTTEHAQRHYSTAKIISRLQEIKEICRENNWYASASYASMAADSLFHMHVLGDKAQRPDFLVTLTDIHPSVYPDSPYDDEDVV